MSRSLVAFSSLLVFVSAVAAQPAGPITLKGPSSGGLSAEQFFASGLAVWAGQLSNETTVLKAELTTSAVAPQIKAALIRSTDAATRVTAAFHRSTLSTTDRVRLAREHQAVDVSLTGLTEQIQRAGVVHLGIAQSLARMQYADEQIHAALLTGGDWRARISHLAATLGSQADELRGLFVDILPVPNRPLDLLIRAFASSCERLSANVGAGGNGSQLLRDFNDVSRRWQAAAPGLKSASAGDAAIRTQVARVEALFQQLAVAVRAVPGIGPGIGIPIVPPGNGLILRGAAFAVGAGEGGGPRVRIFADLRGRHSTDFFAYDPDFRGGVRVALADLNGDGFPEVVTAPGPGMPPLVRVFDGQSLGLLTEFLALDPKWRNGLFVAAADFGRVGKAVVVVGADFGGGPHVRAFDLAAGVELDNFLAYDEKFTGGVRVALGDVNGDGIPDLITSPGQGMAPTVKVYNGRNRAIINEFQAYDPKWMNGVWVAAADLTRNGRADVICGADAGGGPHVRVFEPTRARLLGEVFPYAKSFTGGVRVAGVDLTGTGKIDIVCCPGPTTGLAAVPVRVVDGVTRQVIGEFNPFERNFRGGGFPGAK